MTPDHPWRRLRALPGVDVVWRRMTGTLGATNGVDVIVLNPDQLQVQRRCTLAHELAHIELGHVGGCSSSEEAAAASRAARQLITIDALADALAWTRDLGEVADSLWVDRDTLDVRMQHLDDAERDHLRERLAACERGL